MCLESVSIFHFLQTLCRALPLELAGERFTQCCCTCRPPSLLWRNEEQEGAGFRDPVWMTHGWATQSGLHSMSRTGTLQGRMTDGSVLSCVYSVLPQWWLYQMLFFFFFTVVESVVSCRKDWGTCHAWMWKETDVSSSPRAWLCKKSAGVGIMLAGESRSVVGKTAASGKTSTYSDTVSGWGKWIPPPDLKALSWCGVRGYTQREQLQMCRFHIGVFWENKFLHPHSMLPLVGIQPVR